MRGAVYYGTGDVRIEELDEPVPGPGQVKIAVAYNGLCGTDLHEIFDGPRAVPVQPHPLTGVQAPVVLGHEVAGTVVETGPDTEPLDMGTLVSLEPLVTCGSCPSCRAGRPNLCDRLAFVGLSAPGGGLAEFAVVARSMVHVAPPGLSTAGAAMAEPMAVAWHAVDRSGIAPGRTAVVLGGGPIGIGIHLVLRTRGVEATVVEPTAGRRRIAAGLGAATLDPAEGPVEAALRDATSGSGFDVCFETSGTVAGLATALAATAKRGSVVLLASPRHPLPPILGTALSREIVIRTSYAYAGVFPAVLDALAAGLIPLEGWVTTAPLSRLHEQLDEMRTGQAAKVLIDPGR
jgi:(R,R)-butanediol dehydrogenase/meso-butanediol dehydrogenase/diacetyl reductase